MSISKDIRTYNESFFELVERIENEKIVKIEKLPKSIASNMRMQFYGFRKLILENEMHRNKYPCLAGVSVKILQAGFEFAVEFRIAEETELARWMAQSLAIASNPEERGGSSAIRKQEEKQEKQSEESKAWDKEKTEQIAEGAMKRELTQDELIEQQFAVGKADQTKHNETREENT